MCLFVQCVVSNPAMLFVHVYILNIYVYLSYFIYPRPFLAPCSLMPCRLFWSSVSGVFRGDTLTWKINRKMWELLEKNGEWWGFFYTHSFYLFC